MKKHATFLIFLLLWLAINGVTAAMTELYDDEAYYWMYAQFMDWGYFDHPPGVAVMVKMGSFLGKTELAVRLFNVLFTGISISLIYWLTKPKNPLIFCLSVFSFLVLHLIGFVSLPDGPFFLSAVIFFIAYRAFLQNESLVTTLLLGLAIALMIYCKYHGFVIILFTLLSNPALFKNYRTYVAAAVAILLLSPHFYWQIENNFPSLTYHLADRAAPEYKIRQTLDYLLGNLPFLGGLVSVILFVAAIGYSPKNKWEKALKYNLFGMYIFFLLITFKGQYIEANWTIFCVFPMLYLGYKQIENSAYFTTYKYVTYVFAGILLVIRVHVLSPLTVIKKDRVWDFYGGKVFAETVAKTAGDRRIIANRYQDASLLNFYLDEPYIIPAININSRASQYSIWKFDTLLCRDNIAFVNGLVPGNKIKDRKFDSTLVSLLDKVKFPSCYQLKVISVRQQQDGSAKLQIDVQSADNDFTDATLKVTLFNEKLRISEQVFPIMKAGIQKIDLPMKTGMDVNRVVIRIVSKQLGGSNGQSVSAEF